MKIRKAMGNAKIKRAMIYTKVRKAIIYAKAIKVTNLMKTREATWATQRQRNP
jgi:hypothetical protein